MKCSPLCTLITIHSSHTYPVYFISFHLIWFHIIVIHHNFSKLNKEFELFSQAYSKATSLSYTAGVADLDSVNNFSKDDVDEQNRDDDSNLQQTQEAIQEAKGNLDRIILLLLNNKS